MTSAEELRSSIYAHLSKDIELQNMNAVTISLIKSRIDALKVGFTFDLKSLMDANWASIQSKQSFGREFKKALAGDRLTGIVHDHLDNSPRRDIYRKDGLNAVHKKFCENSRDGV